MFLRATPALIFGIVSMVVGASVGGVLVYGSYLTATARFTSLSSAACPQIGGPNIPVECEKVTLVWPTLPSCIGPVTSYVVHAVTFTLQPYLHCGGVLGWGIHVNVTEPPNPQYSFQLDNGAPPTWWINWSSPDGRVGVDWAAMTSNVTLVVTGALYTVSFVETGLPAGANWSVTFAGALGYGTGETIQFNTDNGSYGFTIGVVSGYTPSPSSGTVTVSGAGVEERVTFA